MFLLIITLLNLAVAVISALIHIADMTFHLGLSLVLHLLYMKSVLARAKARFDVRGDLIEFENVLKFILNYLLKILSNFSLIITKLK